MVRKCGRGIAEIAVMEIGVRTRSQAALAMAVQRSTTTRRRKVKESAKLSSERTGTMTRTKTASFVELGNSQKIELENSAESSVGARTNPSSDFDREARVSCCSSNYGSSEIADDDRHQRDDNDQERIEEQCEEVDRVGDLKDDESNEVETSTYNSSREREMTPSSKLREESDCVESTSKPTVVNSDRRSSSTLAEKMPSEAELEEFFASAEKDIQKRFAEKYNFDIVKDTPLEGRYEWVILKP